MFITRFLAIKLASAMVCVAVAGLALTGSSRGEPARLRVLLIGIGAYNKNQEVFIDLTGDEDMARLESVLKAKFPQAEIDDSLCKPGAATKAAIVGAINALAARSQPGDAIYIAFAGHGTQAPDKSESTGLAQAFVPYDVKIAPLDDPVHGVKKGDVVKESVIDGPEFNRLIKTLRDHVQDSSGLANITLSFDCCHSGSITRGEWKMRGAQNKAAERVKGSGGANDVADEPAIKGLICLSAAQAGEYAWQNGRGGLFTNALLDAFQNLDTTTGGHSYQSLFASIRASMALVDPPPPEAQIPELLGKGDRQIFSTKTLPMTDGYLVATPPDPKGKLTVKMLAGAAFGIHDGDEVGIFKPGTEDPQTSPLATGKVSNAGPTSSFLALDGPARTVSQIKALSGNVALVLKSAPGGRLRILVQGDLPADNARRIAAQPDMEFVPAGEPQDVTIRAPAAASGTWSINALGACGIALAAADLDGKLLDDLRQIQRFRAVQAFGPATKNSEVVVEMRLIPITVDGRGGFTGFVRAADEPIAEPVNSKTPFLIQVRAYGMNGSKHVRGVYDPYIALINGQPNWVVHEVWPGSDATPAESIQAEDHRLIADDKWRTVGDTYGLLTTTTDKNRVGTFGCDASTDGAGEEFWELVATPIAVDYTAFLAPGAAKTTSRGGPQKSPDEWSTATVTVTVVAG